jgi:hypothetical protein
MDMYTKQALIRHIKKYPDYNWHWGTLSVHPRMNEEVLKEFPDKPWNFYSLSTHPKFEFCWFEVLPNKPWSWVELSRNARMENVLKYIDKPWDWSVLTLSDNITEDDMIKNPNMPWVFDLLGYNKIDYQQLKLLRFFRNKFDIVDWIDFTRHTPWEIIKTNLDIPWRPYEITFLPGDISTPDDIKVLEYFMSLGENLYWTSISISADIKIIKSRLDLPWVWNMVSVNPSVKPQDIDQLLPWDYNVFPLEDDQTLETRWAAAKCIQRYWKTCVSDPSYKICKNRLSYEFNNLYI